MNITRRVVIVGSLAMVLVFGVVFLYTDMVAVTISFPKHRLPLYESSYSNLQFIHSLSKDLTVHTAYFDARPRDGHKNVTVLFINVHRDILDPGLIAGCGVDNQVASNFSVYSIFENKLMHWWLGPKPVLYENQLILCYDMPSMNGSRAFALYRASNSSSSVMQTYSHKPVFHPAPKIAPCDRHDFTVVVCAKAHNKKAPWFHEFIQYQKAIGVDHVDFSVLDSFIKDGGYDDLVLKDSVIREALESGFVNFRVWTETYEKNGEVFFHSENLRKLGCVYRYLGTYDYAMPLDTDDFFVPRGTSKNLKDYIEEHCHSKQAGSCRFDWIRYYPELGLVGTVGPDGNVTDHLKNKQKFEVGNFKSAHYTKAILDASFHDARCSKCLLPGYEMITVPNSVAYVAHLRVGEFYKKRSMDN